jgi:hypothetical protein
MFIPVSNGLFFLDAKLGGHLTSRFDADQKMSLCEICSADLVLHIEKSKKALMSQLISGTSRRRPVGSRSSPLRRSTLASDLPSH